MNCQWVLQTGPTIEPISLPDAEAHLRVDSAEDAATITRMIKGARAAAEQYLRRGILTQTWKYAQDDWTDVISLPMAAPLQSVTSLKYYNTSGTLTTLSSSDYVVDTLSTPGRLVRGADVVWPQLQSDRLLRIEVIYVVGWTAAASVPSDIIDAIHLMLGDRYELREDSARDLASIPHGARSLLTPHRVFWTKPTAYPEGAWA